MLGCDRRARICRSCRKRRKVSGDSAAARTSYGDLLVKLGIVALGAVDCAHAPVSGDGLHFVRSQARADQPCVGIRLLRQG